MKFHNHSWNSINIKQQYTSCMKVGISGNLDLSREYHKKLFGPLFYPWWNCPLIRSPHVTSTFVVKRFSGKGNLRCSFEVEPTKNYRIAQMPYNYGIPKMIYGIS